jgi:hypothetical protein
VRLNLRAWACIILAVGLLAPWASSAASSAEGGAVPTLKAGYEPRPLTPGTWRTGGGFVPVTTFRVPRRWYGAQGATGWFLGSGLDRATQEFTAGGIFVDVVALPLTTAVARFTSLKSISAGASTAVKVGGFAGVTFNARVKGEHAPLAALGTGADIPGGVTGRQTFLNVRGKTVLVRLEWYAPRAAVDVQAVFRSFRFPR